MSVLSLAKAKSESAIKLYHEKLLDKIIQDSSWYKKHGSRRYIYRPPLELTMPAGYDVYRCCHYLFTELKKRGFDADFMFPNTILVNLCDESMEDMDIMQDLANAHTEAIKRKKKEAKDALRVNEFVRQVQSQAEETDQNQTDDPPPDEQEEKEEPEEE